MIVVVIIGLLAAIAIPAFQKVRSQSRAKTITMNLRQISSSGQQYILEEGTVDVSYGQLLRDGNFADIDSVAGEDYTTLTVSEEGAILRVSTENNTQTITYTY